MAKKKPEHKNGPEDGIGEGVEIAGAGITVDMPITSTLKENYMPYAMSVIVSRALPEIDGFKPSHRKLLYTMQLMGLQTGARTKSANVVGQTMKLNPHGDMAIYETMVRLSRGNETLLHPFVDSKGNFGKNYSRDMAFAAPRYTEAKLAPIAAELFRDIGKDTVDFVDSYDNKMKEPTLFPVTFPAILVNANIGIAVGMSSSICSFHLAEVCETTVALMKNPGHDIASTLKAPDFCGGGYYLYDREQMSEVIREGRGSLRIRSRYEISGGSVEITEIPPTTTIEAIMDKIADLIKQGKIREISDMRDETDLRGLRLTLDLKRGADAGKLMTKLFRTTPLEDNYSCNFTVLIDGYPKLAGVREILLEWIGFRRTCVTRRTRFDCGLKQQRLHLLNGLAKILLDIDEAIRIIRGTDEEKEVIPNLMASFGIDGVQADYIAEIKLRNLNKEYVLHRINERVQLEKEIDELESILGDGKKIDRIIMEEQAEIAKKYAQPRRTKILYETGGGAEEEEEETEDYPVHIFFTRDGYFKKITPQSLRMNAEQKYKEGDALLFSAACRNRSHLLFFTNMRNVYKARAYQFEDSKASVIGDYVAGTFQFPEGEVAVAMAATDDYAGTAVFFYADGKVGRVPLAAYQTKQNRRKLTNAYSQKSELVRLFSGPEEQEYAIFTTNGRMLLIHSALISVKQSKDTVGVNAVSLRKNQFVDEVVPASALEIESPHKFRAKNLPAAGGVRRDGDVREKEQGFLT